MFANGVSDETIQELKIARRFGDEDTRKRDTVSAELVTVHRKTYQLRVIDRLRKFGRSMTSDKSVKAARSGCGFSTKNEVD